MSMVSSTPRCTPPMPPVTNTRMPACTVADNSTNKNIAKNTTHKALTPYHMCDVHGCGHRGRAVPTLGQHNGQVPTRALPHAVAQLSQPLQLRTLQTCCCQTQQKPLAIENKRNQKHTNKTKNVPTQICPPRMAIVAGTPPPSRTTCSTASAVSKFCMCIVLIDKNRKFKLNTSKATQYLWIGHACVAIKRQKHDHK